MKALACAAAGALWLATTGAALPEPRGYELLSDVIGRDSAARQRAARRLAAAADSRWIAPLVDALFFVPKAARGDALRALAALAGEDRGDRYLDWIESVGAHDWGTPAGYADWKADLLARIDRRYKEILYPGAPARLRFEELVFGGVGVEGIPALDRPAAASAAAVDFLAADELVFGVRVGEAARAYPLRVLSWHEMANDVVGGEPISLSYCTLCGSGLAWSGRLASGAVVTFGTSGLLYRSNKLMLDRETKTLWSQLTGEAVVGRLAAGEAARLRLLPTTVTRWREWRARNPESSALVPDPLLAKRWGFDYSPGAADRARAGVRFPVWQKDGRLEEREEIVGVRDGPHARAFAISQLVEAGVVNDTVGATALALVADRRDGAVRVFERGALRFRPDSVDSANGALRDEQGRRWRLEEAELRCDDERCAGLEPLRRWPSVQAFWFAWFGFFPRTEVWSPTPVVP